MKKLSAQNRKHNNSSSEKQFRNRLRRKDKEYNPVKAAHFTTKIPQIAPSLIHFENLDAPAKFNLQYENCEQVIKYINLIKRVGERKRSINIRLNKIEEIGDGAIAMLLSVIDELTRNGILIKGTKPKNLHAKDILEKSGFFTHMSGSIEKRNLNTKNTILKTGGISGSTLDLSSEIKKANDTVWGLAGRNPSLRGCVFEMMRNSCDHAFKKQENIILRLVLKDFFNWFSCERFSEEPHIIEFKYKFYKII